MKQLTKNPIKRSEDQGWQLMDLLAQLSVPSKFLAGFLKNFLRRTMRVRGGSEVAKIATRALKNLEIVFKSYAKEKPPPPSPSKTDKNKEHTLVCLTAMGLTRDEAEAVVSITGPDTEAALKYVTGQHADGESGRPANSQSTNARRSHGADAGRDADADHSRDGGGKKERGRQSGYNHRAHRQSRAHRKSHANKRSVVAGKGEQPVHIIAPLTVGQNHQATMLTHLLGMGYDQGNAEEAVFISDGTIQSALAYLDRNGHKPNRE